MKHTNSFENVKENIIISLVFPIKYQLDPINLNITLLDNAKYCFLREN